MLVWYVTARRIPNLGIRRKGLYGLEHMKVAGAQDLDFVAFLSKGCS